MAHRSAPALRVLHALRIKGIAEDAAVARASGLPDDEVARLVRDLAGTGQVERREGPVAGWRLTPAGVETHTGLVSDELGHSGARAAIEDAHVRFLQLNPELLALCTAWQLRELDGARVRNDHLDASYDGAVVEGLVDLHRRVIPVLDGLAAHLDRYSGYLPRLQEALDRVQAGELEWFTAPLLDSYHSVWFELHQDLLDTLALERASGGVRG